MAVRLGWASVRRVTLVKYEVDGAGARITLNRAAKRNAIDERTIEELREALEKPSSDAETRAVLLAGEGSDFCSGMDLQMMAQGAHAAADEHLKDAERLADLYQSLR